MQHSVHFFDDTLSRSETVAAFLQRGLRQDETLLVVATKPHWQSTARLLAERRVPVEAAAQSGQLTVLDAADALALVGGDQRQPGRFDRTVGALVRQLASRTRPVSVYGELVDLLAGRGDFEGALRLEEMWSRLMTEVPLTLRCGYSASLFAGSSTSGPFQSICQVHSEVYQSSAMG